MKAGTKLIYASLLLLLLAEPFLIYDSVFGIPESLVESIVLLVILILLYLNYYFYQKDYNLTNQKLIESYAYIGQVNRHLPLLKDLTSGILQNSKNSENQKKETFVKLLSIAAVSLAKVDWAIFRIINRQTYKTVREFMFTSGGVIVLTNKIGNKDLLLSRNTKGALKLSEMFWVYATSEEESEELCFLILPNAGTINLNEDFILQAIVDQAQILYKYLYITK